MKDNIIYSYLGINIGYPACRGIIEKLLRNYLYFKRLNIRPNVQLITNIHKETLLIHDKPFVSTGVNYFESFFIKYLKILGPNQRLIMRYSVIYPCLTITAIDLELAGGLATDSFFLFLCLALA